VREAINLATLYIKSKNSTLPHWFSNSLKYYIKKKTQHFRRYKKSKYDHNYSVFSYYRKLAKTTIKTDRLSWLKSIDNNQKTKPKDFGNMSLSLKRMTMLSPKSEFV
jgi:hypothetical protein